MDDKKLKPKSGCPECRGRGFIRNYLGKKNGEDVHEKKPCHCLNDGQAKPQTQGFFTRMMSAAKTAVIKALRLPNPGCPNCQGTGKMGRIGCWCVSRKNGPKLYKFPPK